MLRIMITWLPDVHLKMSHSRPCLIIYTWFWFDLVWPQMTSRKWEYTVHWNVIKAAWFDTWSNQWTKNFSSNEKSKNFFILESFEDSIKHHRISVLLSEELNAFLARSKYILTNFASSDNGIHVPSQIFRIRNPKSGNGIQWRHSWVQEVCCTKLWC